MIVSGLILAISMLVFAIGKSPVFRVDRAGIAIIGAALTVGAGVLNNKNQLMLMVILITGILSAFFINDIVCLFLTPIVIMITRQVKLNPTPYLLGVATASNIGSAATLIGNPQNILIESISRINFGWYMALRLIL